MVNNVSVKYSGPSFNRPLICRRPDTHNMCFFLFLSFFSLEMSLFPSIFCAIAVFSCMECTSYVLSFRMVFSTLRPQDGFLTSAYYVRIQTYVINGGLLPDIIIVVLLTLCDYIIQHAANA